MHGAGTGCAPGNYFQTTIQAFPIIAWFLIICRLAQISFCLMASVINSSGLLLNPGLHEFDLLIFNYSNNLFRSGNFEPPRSLE